VTGHNNQTTRPYSKEGRFAFGGKGWIKTGKLTDFVIPD
jgi:hypothetical protein